MHLSFTTVDLVGIVLNLALFLLCLCLLVCTFISVACMGVISSHSDLIFHRIGHISQNVCKFVYVPEIMTINVKKNQVFLHIFYARAII